MSDDESASYALFYLGGVLAHPYIGRGSRVTWKTYVDATSRVLLRVLLGWFLSKPTSIRLIRVVM